MCVCVIFLFRPIFGHLFFSVDIWAFRSPQFPAKKIKRPSLTGRQGLTEQVCKFSGSISKKRREKLGFCAKNMCDFAQLSLSLISFIMGSTFGVKYGLILALRGQIFGYLLEPMDRHALGHLEPARSENNEKNGFLLRKRLTPIVFFWRPVVGGDTFSPLAPVLGPEEKNWVHTSPSSTAHGGQHNIKYVTLE